ncbi:hypothetical protein BVRB_6g149130 [Beta vulgaris subsp. vulgaris]|nr:hypothetical protein BVRB_6g149130 [Beta vulgaris subsp. vulgaris]
MSCKLRRNKCYFAQRTKELEEYFLPGHKKKQGDQVHKEPLRSMLRLLDVQAKGGCTVYFSTLKCTMRSTL